MSQIIRRRESLVLNNKSLNTLWAHSLHEVNESDCNLWPHSIQCGMEAGFREKSHHTNVNIPRLNDSLSLKIRYRMSSLLTSYNYDVASGR
jgi:hypothetical protein